MKKITILAITLLMMLIVAPAQAIASSKTASLTNTMTEAESKILVDRLKEIKSMDRSDLNSIEKKELRKEVRDIKENLKSNADGVYLSVGALLIVILLLILLL